MSTKDKCEVFSGNETCPQAHAAAEQAVIKVFAIIGVNVSDPEKVEQFREELRFGRKVKRISDRTAISALSIIVAIAITTLLKRFNIWQ